MNNINFKELKPVNYNRKSSEDEERQALSIPAQIEEIEKLRRDRGLGSMPVLEESRSAKLPNNRKIFGQMITDIISGKFDTILCWKLDRLARNMVEGGLIIDLLQRGVIKFIITPHKIYTPEENALLMAVEFGSANQFVRDLSINVKRGQRKKASNGVPHGVATLGFLNDKTEEKGNRKWIVDETRLNSIKILLDMFLTGTYSAGKLHKYAVNVLKLTTVKRKKCGGELIVSSRIYEILKDPIYAGFFFYGGERYELDRTLPRLITEAQHKKIKLILSNKNIPKVQHHQTTYSGFITSEEGHFIGQDVKFQVICDCKKKFAYRNKTHCPNCNIEIDKMENPKYLSYIFHYNVKSKKAGLPYKNIAEEKISKAVVDLFVNNIAFSGDIVEWSKKHIHEMKEKELSEKIIINQRKEERKVEFQEKKARSRAMFRDNKINEEDYNEDLARLNLEYADVNEKTESIDWYSRLMEIADITSRIASVLKSDNIQAKRNILSALGTNLVWNDENLLIINKKEIEALISGVQRYKPTHSKYEPKNYVISKGLNEKNPAETELFSTMLRG